MANIREDEGEESSRVGTIPHEVVHEILTRLPVKSLLQFKSVSHLWNTTVSDPFFSRSHLSHSLSRPNGGTLFITFPNQSNTERFIFSAKIDPNEPRSNLQSHYQLTVHGSVDSFVSPSLQGLIAFGLNSCICICNPTTRKFKILPPTNAKSYPSPRFTCNKINSLGFDPVSNEHKVLNTRIIRTDDDNETIIEHRVFKLGSDQWRRIDDDAHYFPFQRGVCVNGFIYFLALNRLWDMKSINVVAFEVGSEEFRLIELPDGDYESFVTMDCGGKLALVNYHGLRDGNNLEMLEQVENQGWVKKVIELPTMWREVMGNRRFNLAGTNYKGEMIFAPRELTKPFYVCFYDMKKDTVRRVEICGLPEYKFRNHHSYPNITVTDHVESILSLG